MNKYYKRINDRGKVGYLEITDSERVEVRSQYKLNYTECEYNYFDVTNNWSRKGNKMRLNEIQNKFWAVSEKEFEEAVENVRG